MTFLSNVLLSSCWKGMSNSLARFKAAAVAIRKQARTPFGLMEAYRILRDSKVSMIIQIYCSVVRHREEWCIWRIHVI